MQRYLKLSSRITSDTMAGCSRLQAWVSEYSDMDPKIFVYQRMPLTPGVTVAPDVYTNVASAADMVEYPPDEPVDGSSSESYTCPFFRLSSFDLVFRSDDLMVRSWATIKGDVRALISNLDRLDLLGEDSDVEFRGRTIPDHSSGSGSGSGASTGSGTATGTGDETSPGL